MKLFFALAAGIIFGAVGVIGGYFFLTSSEVGDDTVRVTFTEAEIQEKIGKDFPKTERILSYISIVIREPKVKFIGKNNRVQLTVNATVNIPFLRSDDIDGIFTGSIRYEKEDKTLRTSDYTVESLKTETLPREYEGPVRMALDLAAKKYLDDYIVHTLKPEDYKGKMAEMFLQEIRIKEGKLEVVLGL